MKKIVFTNLPMKKKLKAFKYFVDGNTDIDSDGEVIFPINAVLAKSMTKNDVITVVLIKKLDLEGNGDVNAGAFMKELNTINRNVGADINYRIIDTPFEEGRDTHEKLLREMIEEVKEKSLIYADITYGPKSLPIIVFSVLNFAEKFFNCEIRNIVYGKVDFITKENGESEPSNPILCDMTPLYYLNSVTNSMECKTGQDAKRILDNLLNI